jgi:osmotically-inducible protein OsmY
MRLRWRNLRNGLLNYPLEAQADAVHPLAAPAIKQRMRSLAMVYERYPRNNGGGQYSDRDNYGQDYGSGREFSYSSARDYEAAGIIGPRADRDRPGGDYRQRDEFGGDRGYYSQPRDQGRYQSNYSSQYGYDSDNGSRYTVSGNRNYGRDMYRDQARGDYGRGRQPEGYDYQDRGFLNRAGDEVRSWFGDDEAERRRSLDQRYDQQYRHDDDYHAWRSGQIAALDRDYDEYRRENRTKFSNEFGSWRNERNTQRGSLERVAEHMEVVGSDGEHVGTVDKVRGDRILLTKSDADAGGRHHSIPSRWIDRVDDKVTVRKTAEEAKAHWRDEERNSAFFGDNASAGEDAANRPILNRSFSGTY